MANESSDRVMTIVKVVFDTIQILLFGLHCYINLIFRVFYPKPKKCIDGDIMLITGSSAGIGRATVLELAQNHPRTTLVLWDWNEEGNLSTADEARKLGAKKVFTYTVDVSNRATVETTADRVRSEVGHVSILFNNAGYNRIGPLLEVAPEDLEKTIQVNLIAHMWTLRAFLPHMIEVNRGAVVTMASFGSYVAFKYGVHYFGSKFGVRGYMEALKDELRVHPRRPTGVKLTTIYPSWVRTDMPKGITLKVTGVDDEDKLWLKPEEVAKAIVDGILREEEKVMIPKHMELLALFKSLTPDAFYQKVTNSLSQGEFTPPDTNKLKL